MAYCTNHPTIEANATCVVCGQPFCDACLVQMPEGRSCLPCRDRQPTQMRTPLVLQALRTEAFAGTGRVEIGRWLSAGWQIVSGDLVTFAAATFLFVVLSLCSCTLLTGPMLCGLYLMAFRKMAGGRAEVKGVFDGFKRAIAIPAWLLLVVVQTAIARLAEGPQAFEFGWTSGARGIHPSVPMPGGPHQWIVPLVLGVLTPGFIFFVFPHIAARNVGPIDALRASWAVVRRNFLMFCLAGWLFATIAELGVFACTVGVLVTLPWMVAASAQAYADHFGIEGWGVGSGVP